MHHFADLMRESGRSLFLSDCQGLESVHSALRKSDIRHNCHITNAQGTPIHEEMSLRSVAFYNSRCLGYHEATDNDIFDAENNNVEVDAGDNERNCETLPARGFNGLSLAHVHENEEQFQRIDLNFMYPSFRH